MCYHPNIKSVHTYIFLLGCVWECLIIYYTLLSWYCPCKEAYSWKYVTSLRFLKTWLSKSNTPTSSEWSLFAQQNHAIDIGWQWNMDFICTVWRREQPLGTSLQHIFHIALRAARLALQSILVLWLSSNVRPNGVINSKHFSSESKANSCTTKLRGNNGR